MMNLSLQKLVLLVVLLLAVVASHARPTKTRGARAISMTKKRLAAIGALSVSNEHDRLAHTVGTRLLAKEDKEDTDKEDVEVEAAEEEVAEENEDKEDKEDKEEEPVVEDAKEEDEPEEEPEEEPTKEEEPTEEVEPAEEGPAVEEEDPVATEAVVVEGNMTANATNATEPAMTTEGETYDVTLAPFRLELDGPVVENNLDLAGYLETYLKELFPGLVNVTLTAEIVDIPDPVDAMANMTMNATEEIANITLSGDIFNMTMNMTVEEEVNGDEEVDGDDVVDEQAQEEAEGEEEGEEEGDRYLRGGSMRHRDLKQVVYVTGVATFMGDGNEPVVADDVVAAQEDALGNVEAIQEFFTTEYGEEYPDLIVEDVVVGNNATVPPAPTDAPASASASTSEEYSGGLTTTGLVIVIVAACVGGISLFIIVIVGFSNPAGNVKKRGLPEQTLQ